MKLNAANISLTLYIIGMTPLSKRALINIESICAATPLANKCTLNIVDLNDNPGLAEQKKILATPLLIKNTPKPEIRILGDLSNIEKIISLLELERP